MKTIKVILVCLAVIAFGGLGGFASSMLATKHFYSQTPQSNVVTNTSQTPSANLASQMSAPTISSLATKLSPAIVDITTTSTSYSYFGGPITEEGAGTGMIVSSNGYIITNNHVLPLNPSPITVRTTSGTSYTAQIIATDPTRDLALLKISATGLKVVPLGDSNNEVVGDEVIAIGNALGQFENTVTQGIISGLNRKIDAGDQESPSNTETLTGIFQTDAPINPGNSGGPLIDIATGTVIGMNTATSSDGQNISFSIPINQIKSFISPYTNGFSNA